MTDTTSSLNECANGEHQFTGRYDKKPFIVPQPAGFGMTVNEVHYQLQYVKDICTKCGKESKR